MRTFTIGENDFLLDGRPHRVLSGAVHYFRVHPDDWAARIRAARLMGLNTIETYVAWNEHAPRRGRFDLSGRLDLGRFLDTVAAEGMHAIVRPGPYICAEFDNGGLPAWLTGAPDVELRRTNTAYLDAVREYLEQLAPVLVPRQIHRGGPIILVQVENEYGAYGDDHAYLRRLTELTRQVGITVPLTSIDQPTDEMLAAGGIPELHRTGSFGSDAAVRLATLRRHQPSGPLLCAEFWDGWFDSWGTRHHTTSAEKSAAELDALLAAGASVNIYMFHGGTNFGLTNGANHKGRYVPIATSYDYDAPLDEAGRPTAKYWAFRDVIAKYAPVPEEQPADPADAPTLEVDLAQRSLLSSEVFAEPTYSEHPLAFDVIGHARGYGVYRAHLDAGPSPVLLEVGEVRDRAWVRLDGRYVGTLARDAHERALVLPAGRGELELFVEDQGRVNYGPLIGEEKGLIGPITVDGRPVTEWSVAPLRLDAIPEIVRTPSSGTDSSLWPGGSTARGVFRLSRPSGLFLETGDWGKGLVWINGFLLGRYWRRGPQQTLFVPEGATRRGANELTVLELETRAPDTARLVSGPEYGPVED
ncbi:glycoside hydrolase family 35 protein [Microbacterium sp. EST19A]|uniref:glycoside hydrolase family 35 protein n=1 Tax=Microbacterium sp. EST19A TaxID=2862681 RepID=UPI001CBD6B5A|nr:glycoside hydrolase family 35 protein [Microbacterium sp. EST19A]